MRNYIRQITDDSDHADHQCRLRACRTRPSRHCSSRRRARPPSEASTSSSTPASDVPQLDDALAADVNTVMGNLIDNAFDAAAGGADPVRARGAVARRRRRHRDRSTTAARASTPTIGEMVFTTGFSTKASHRAGARHRPGHRPGDLPQPRRRHRRAATTRVRSSWPPCRCCCTRGLVIRVLVVDDDFMVARLHSSVVARQPGFEVAGIAQHRHRRAAGGRGAPAPTWSCSTSTCPT